MKFVIVRSREYLVAQQVATGKNLAREIEIEVEPAALAAETRQAIVSAYGRYPDRCHALAEYGRYAEFFADVEPEVVVPALVDSLIAQVVERDQAQAAAKKAEAEAAEAEKQATFAAQSVVIDQFLADAAARPERLDSGTPFWAAIGGQKISQSHPRWDELLAELERRKEIDAAAEAVAKQAAADRLTAQIADWVAAKGTDSQRARLAYGLLPAEEVVEAIRAEALAPGKDLPEYQLSSKSDLTAECEAEYPDEDAEPKFSVKDATELTDEQYAGLVRVREAFPGAEVTPRRHEGALNCGCDACPLHEVVRFGAKVHVQVGEIHATKEFAI